MGQDRVHKKKRGHPFRRQGQEKKVAPEKKTISLKYTWRSIPLPLLRGKGVRP
jgi:hypothetical protein